MKTLRFYGTVLMAVLFTSLVACSESSDSKEEQESPSVPVNPGDYQDVPATGGVIKKGDIAINFPSGTFDSDTKVAITEVKKGTVGGVCEASPFYQLTLPMSTKKPIAVKIKADNSSEDAEFVIRSPGYAVSLVSDVTNEATAETTYSNGVYTTTFPAFDNSDGKDNVSITIGLCKLPDDNAARRTTRANHSVIGKEGNITWELDIDYWSEYSLDYKKLETKLPTVNLYIKEAIRTIHSLGFKLPDGVKLNYHLADTRSWLFGDSWGYYSRSLICRSRDGIWLKDELVLLESDELIRLLKQTIIHETLHNFQSYYLPSGLPNPIGNYNAMFEMGAVWIEKFMNGGEPNGSWQMNEEGLHNTFKYHFRFGLSRESIDIMNLFIGLSPFAEYGYALGPLLHYMVSKKYPRGYDDTVVESLYSSYWGRIAQSDATVLDVLDEWFNTTYVKTDEEFFNGTDNINEYYLALWKGEVMKDFSLTTLQQGMKSAKLNIDLLNEKKSKLSLDGMVYPYGCEGMVFKMDKTCFKDSVLKDNEMVVKQEAEGLKTYLLYTKGTTIIQHPKAATKGDSITVSGEELEALRKNGAFNSTFFLLTVRTTGDLIDKYEIPSKESVELRKTSSTLKMNDITDLTFEVRVKCKDSYNGNEQLQSVSIGLYSFDDYKITQKGSTVHLEFTKSKEEQNEIAERELSFDIVDFSKEAYNLDQYGPGSNGPATSRIENLTYLDYTKTMYSEQSQSEYRIKEVQVGLPTMYHIPTEASRLGYYHFLCEKFNWGGVNFWTLDAFSYKETYKDWGKSPREHNWTKIQYNEEIIYLKLKYDYNTEKK